MWAVSITCLLLSLTLSGVSAIPELTQVHVITRHGARTTLSKIGSLREEGKASLTLFGEKQMYDVGVWLRDRYVIEGLLGNTYNEESSRFETSHVERTIASANAMALGLFPPETRSTNPLLPAAVYRGIPVYMTEQRNDIHIRAYGKCPEFHDRLSNLYTSSNWTSIEKEYMSELTNLAQSKTFEKFKNGAGYIPLSELWNVYDVINVALTECDRSSDDEEGCSVSQELTNELDNVGLPWAILESLAHLAENRRYGRETAGDLLAGNLLFRIHERMGGDMSDFSTSQINPESGGFRKFYHYSAHYPTLMSIFATLGLPSPSNEVLPGFGAAFIFELYTDAADGAKTIRMLYKETKQQEPFTVKFTGACDGQVECGLHLFTQMMLSLSYSSPEEWCKVCRNEEADVCLSVKLNEEPPGPAPVSAVPTLEPTLQQNLPPMWTPIEEVPVPAAPATAAPAVSTPTLDPTFAPAVLAPTLNPSFAPAVLAPTLNPRLPKSQPISDELSPDELLNWPTSMAVTCPRRISSSTVAGSFLGGIGLGMVLLAGLRYFTALRDKKEVDCSDSQDPDNIIDLDYAGGSYS